jgi:DHA1 family tetracycline resistance protein-like MFS transporter
MEWNARSAAFAFAGLGLISAFVQGFFIRRLVPRLGEPRLIVAGISTVALGFATLALASSALELAVSLILVGVGQGLASPSISGLLSRITPRSEQGSVFGTLTSAQTLARMISYSTSNVLLGQVSTSAPYWFGFTVYVASLAVALRFLFRPSVDANGDKTAVAGAHAVTARGTVD